ncbi:ABC transporter ATP-binding protein [bacterium]|nr:ABC transporter ATP-binding protein [bacterium]
MQNILEIKNLHLGFKKDDQFFEAVHGVNFDLRKGELHALVGESGCGKTVTAMSILKLLPKTAAITEGEVIYKGENILNYTNAQMNKIRGAQIALIPQDPMTSLNPLYTVGNQILEVLRLHKYLEGAEAEKKAIEAFDLVKIPDAKNRLKSYPHEFSGGMKQRAIIAMALACDSEIIIADEPTTALDVTIQAQIMNILSDIKKEKQTSIILITHDLALVHENADRISVMYAGEIVEHGKNKEFFNNPKHPYTNALINSLPNTGKDILDTISGKPPTIEEIISGCKFNPRCKFCDKSVCIKDEPPIIQISPTHIAKCALIRD